MGLWRIALQSVVAVMVAVTVGCAHAPSPQQKDVRRLRALEMSFHDFTGAKLKSISDIEPQTARLEALRLDYLDALAETTGEGESVLALLRLAELHLDLAARIRRVPYPKELPQARRGAYDAMLSSRALPLEATGMSLLDSVIERGSELEAEGRFIARTRLYQRLAKGEALTDDDIELLRQELSAQTYRAPRTLLDTGRLGQRAARR